FRGGNQRCQSTSRSLIGERSREGGPCRTSSRPREAERRSLLEAALERLELVVDPHPPGPLLEIAEARLDVPGVRIVDHVVGLDLRFELVDAAAQPLEIAERAARAAELLAGLLPGAPDLGRERALAGLE